MGSAIPQAYDSNGPLFSDEFELTFTGSGTLAVGNSVTLSAAYTVATTTGTTSFFLGVVSTSGQLAGAVNVVVRGVAGVVADGAVTAGHFLTLSSTAGQVHDGGAYTSLTNGSLPRAIALNSATTQGQVINILLF